MGGVNVAAAVAIPVVLVLLLPLLVMISVVVVALCVRYYRNQKKRFAANYASNLSLLQN